MYRAHDDVENALIARVRAGDLAARLVYADMLEQRGELSRAMFLRYPLTEQDGPWLAAIGWTSRDFASSSLKSDDGRDEILSLSSNLMILPTRSTQIIAIAQGPLPLQPWRLVVSESGTAGGVADWVIDDIRIGNRSQFRQSGSIPAALLVRDDELARHVAFDLVMPRRSVTMDVTYIGLNEGGAYFFAWLVGKTLRPRDVITSRS